jgi:SAM-dependent methyltransferase
MPSTGTLSDTARRWGALWGSRADAWRISEEQQGPTYEAVLDRVAAAPGGRVLEVGCGTGVFLRLAADRGLAVTGLDASEALLAVARERVPEADLHLGDMQALPFADDAFDLVAGFNAFFFADDLVTALREAGRVARPGAPVVIQVWGRPERCDLEAMKAVVRRFRSPGGGGAAPPPYWKPGVLEDLAGQAGLVPGEAFDVTWSYAYADDAEAADALVAPGGIATVVGPEREPELRAAVLEAIAPMRTGTGGYQLENEWHVVIAHA